MNEKLVRLLIEKTPVLEWKRYSTYYITSFTMNKLICQVYFYDSGRLFIKEQAGAAIVDGSVDGRLHQSLKEAIESKLNSESRMQSLYVALEQL